MKYETAIEVIEAISETLDNIPKEKINTWNLFVNANSIVSEFEELECLMNINFVNGSVCQGICVITDWTPGLVVLQTDDGTLPKLRVVTPEDTSGFMKEMKPILEPKYPEFPEEPDEE